MTTKTPLQMVLTLISFQHTFVGVITSCLNLVEGPLKLLTLLNNISKTSYYFTKTSLLKLKICMLLFNLQ